MHPQHRGHARWPARQSRMARGAQGPPRGRGRRAGLGPARAGQRAVGTGWRPRTRHAGAYHVRTPTVTLLSTISFRGLSSAQGLRSPVQLGAFGEQAALASGADALNAGQRAPATPRPPAPHACGPAR